MVIKLADFYANGQHLLLILGGCIMVTAVWLVVESALAVRRYRREGTRTDLDIRLPE